MVKIVIDRSTSSNSPGRISQRVSQTGTLSPAGTSGGERKLSGLREDTKQQQRKIIQLEKIRNETSIRVAQGQKKIVENNYLANSRVNANKQVIEARSSLLSELEDPVGFADNLDSELDKIYDEILKQAPTDASRAALQNVFAQKKMSSYQQAVATESKLLAEKVLNDASNNLDQIAIDIFEEPASFESRLKDIDAIVESTEDILSPIERDKFQQLAKKRLTDFYVKGLIDKSIGEAEIFVNSNAISDVFSADEVLKYRDAVERKKIQTSNELIKQGNQEEEAMVLNRELEIFKGSTSQLQLDEDFEKGLYGIKEYIGLSNKLRTKENTDSLISDSITRVNERQKLGIPFDTTDTQTKKDLNSYYENIVAPTLTKENVDELVSIFVDKFAFIPDKVKSDLMAGLHNGSDNEVVKASRMIDSLTTNNPQLSRQFSTTNDMARAMLISKSVSAGMEPETAVKAADNMIVQKGTVQQDLKRKEFKDSKPSFSQGKITSFFVDDPNSVPAAMKDDWRTLYENYATNLNMSLDDASDLAYKIINSQWGLTKEGTSFSTATGEPKYMKHAPEKYYNQQGLDPNWMEEQLKDDVTLIDSEIKDYDISIDPDTIGTETPGYFINYLSKDGIPLMLRGKDDKLLLWRPDINSSGNVVNQIKVKDESFKDIKRGSIDIQDDLNEFLGFEQKT